MNRSVLSGAAICTLILAATYAMLVHRRLLNWGATEAEVNAPLPGDEVLSEIDVQSTRAITIDAPPHRVWPWLVQIGARPRAGFYTYEWVERLLGLDIENAERILPEFQRLDVGEFFPLGKKGAGLRVSDVQPERAVVLQFEPEGFTWAFVLHQENGDKTRMLSRNRLRRRGPFFDIWAAIMVPLTFLMERKMLLGFKQRAERLATVEATAARDQTA